MKKYEVTGMSCAACSARVEKAVSSVEGVTSCSVNLLTNSMMIEGDVDDSVIVNAVEKAGYGASPMQNGVFGSKGSTGTGNSNKGSTGNSNKGSTGNSSKGSTGTGNSANSNSGSGNSNSNSIHRNSTRNSGGNDTRIIRNRLIVSIIFLLILMYFSMGHMMWNWPVSKALAHNHVAMGILQMLLSGIVMVINQKFFISGFKSLVRRSPNMDTLVALGSMASFVWSVAVLFAMTDAQLKNDTQLVMKYMDSFYFESAAMILVLITVGKMLESMSKGKTTDALKGLMSLAPEYANVIENDKEIRREISEVCVGDIFVVRPGESIPVDGVVIDGSSAVNESVLTGESIPADKTVGSKVSAATINQSGFIKCKAIYVGNDTALARIIQMVSDASATKAPIAKVADRVSGVFVPIVIAISVVTFIIWIIAGAQLGFALARAISVLVISCPCALGLATPVAIMVGSGVGARNGILFKNATSLEETGKAGIVVLDKTGTITNGTPVVTDIVSDNKEELLKYAVTLECKSEHPLAVAINKYGEDNKVVPLSSREFKALAGNGLEAEIGGNVISGGSVEFISSKCNISDDIRQHAMEFADQGKTPLMFAKDSEYLGMIVVADTIKSDSSKAVKELQDMGIKVVMLTGDNERTAATIGKQAGVDRVIAGVLPDEKENVISTFISEMDEQAKKSGKMHRKRGRIIMVGDGINDAPALARADIGIAIGAGTDIAIDAADIVLMRSRLTDVAAAIRLSRSTLKNIHENLFWAFIYNIVGIPIAAGVFVAFGLTLNPMLGAAAMSLSSFCVVTNALRLNLWNKAGSEQSHNKEGDKKNMIKTVVKIDGMMCEMCEKHVNEAFEKGLNIVSVSSSHSSKETTIMSEEEITEEQVKAILDATPYKYVSMTSSSFSK